MNLKLELCLAVTLFVASAASAQCDSGSDGSDGTFNPASSVQIDLGLATAGPMVDALTTPGTGNGVYDATRWVVCFKYNSINIPSGVTITFKNHPSGAPVVWLSQGNVSIAGTVKLTGGDASSTSVFPAEPGPGGFQGSVRGFGPSGPLGSGGFGPGGAAAPAATGFGSWCGAGGGYGAAGANGACGSPGGTSYGNANVIPLIGGSGAAGANYCGTGGSAGGGAIVIAAGLTGMPAAINVTGIINATGGSGSSYGGTGTGSGGAIRLVASTVSGTAATMLATAGLNSTSGCNGYQGGLGGAGRIRIDSPNITMTGQSTPTYTTDLDCIGVFPPPNAPMLQIVSVDGQAAPADPQAGILTPDVSINTAATVPVSIAATNVPTNATMVVRIVPFRGQNLACPTAPMTCPASFVSGSLSASTWQAMIPFTPGRTEIQVKANW